MAEKLTINADDLTIGDLEEIEEIAGAPAGEVFQANFSAKVLCALIFVVQRHAEPGFTMDHARAVRFGDIDLVTDDELEARALAAGDTGPSDDGSDSEI